MATVAQRALSILVTGGLVMLLALTGQAETLAEISSVLFMISGNGP